MTYIGKHIRNMNYLLVNKSFVLPVTTATVVPHELPRAHKKLELETFQRHRSDLHLNSSRKMSFAMLAPRVTRVPAWETVL